jgi:deoxyribodipyrimidine photo-lyase
MAVFSKALCWIRRDLRLVDHRALAEATARAREVLVVFVYDRVILDVLEDRDDKRLFFIHQSLEEVDQGLKGHGSRLAALHGDPVDLIPQLAAAWGAEAVFASHDDDPYALARDAEAGRRLAAYGRVLETHKDCLIRERREVLNGHGEPFKVYTPYMKAWRLMLRSEDLASHDPDYARLCRNLPPDAKGNLALADLGFAPSSLWLEPGESGGTKRLLGFLNSMDSYHEQRDIPSIPGTSGLSVHLRHGTVSVRECFRQGLAREGKGAEKWVNELIWREFYHMILSCFPHVVEGSFQRQYDSLEWPGTEEHFEAWREGQTGFPIVDAAMRCLNQTGWMHNRLRMIAASFLAKDLMVDWRRGEAWFARKLLDFELASNNGGWQWSASTGVDAQPYFRVFNPWLQSVKFDPNGDFIREWCPELSGLDNKDIHQPSEAGLLSLELAGVRLGDNYPHPIVVHSVQKDKAIALFKAPS